MGKFEQLYSEISNLNDRAQLEKLSDLVGNKLNTITNAENVQMALQFNVGDKVHVREEACNGKGAVLVGKDGEILRMGTKNATVQFEFQKSGGESVPVWKIPFSLLKRINKTI